MILLIGAQSTPLKELRKHLEEDSLKVAHIEDRMQILTALSVELPQMIVLDCDEHGVRDLTFCQEIRRQYSGLFILLSDIANSDFDVFALNIGVDASFPKSSSHELTVANIKSLLRRFIPSEPVTQLVFGSLLIDLRRRDAFIEDVASNLSTIEFEIFRYLVQKPGCVITREEIHREIYKTEYNGYDRSIDLYISRIRQKIGDSPSFPVFLKTVRGAGYQFVTTPGQINQQGS